MNRSRPHIYDFVLKSLFFAVVVSMITACVHMKSDQEDLNTPSVGALASGNAPDIPDDIMRHAAMIGPGDVIEIRVYREEELTGEFRVNSDGTIIFPYLNAVDVNNKSANDVALELQEGLKKYLKQPYVSVFIKEFKSSKIYVFGQVKKPGTFTYEDNMSIVQAITLADGFTDRAAKDSTSVTRIVDGKETRYTLKVDEIGRGRAPNFILQPGDIVYVPEGFF